MGVESSRFFRGFCRWDHSAVDALPSNPSPGRAGHDWGTPVPGLLRASVVATNSFSADTFSLAFTAGARKQAGFGFWSDLGPEAIEIGTVEDSIYGRSIRS